MKTTINTLLATILITLTASASPALLVETTITEHHAKGGKLEYAVTPTLLDDGTVDLRAVLTERDGKNADRLAAPQIKSKLGQVAEIQIGQLAFTTKTSLAK